MPAPAHPWPVTIIEFGNVFLAIRGARQLANVGRVAPAVTLADEMAEISANLCFTPDTIVHTEHGPKPIGRIDAGEHVLGFDFSAGKWIPKCVIERLDSRHDGAIVTIETDDGTSVSSTLYHPYWVISGRDLGDRPQCHELAEDEDQGQSLTGRWVNSHDVQAGDIVFDSGNNRRTVVRVSQEFRPGGTPVCNLMIEDLHNYAVGTAGILVHNTTWCDDAIEEFIGIISRGEPYRGISAANIDDVIRHGIESGVNRESLEALITRAAEVAADATGDGSRLLPSHSVTQAVSRQFFRNARAQITDEIAKLATDHVIGSGKTVIGKWEPGARHHYITVAKNKSASYYSLDPSVWNSLSEAEQCAANQHFLDAIADAGDTVLVSIRKGEIIPGTSLAREVEYLRTVRNYRWVNDVALKPRG